MGIEMALWMFGNIADRGNIAKDEVTPWIILAPGSGCRKRPGKCGNFPHRKVEGGKEKRHTSNQAERLSRGMAGKINVVEAFIYVPSIFFELKIGEETK